MMVSHIRSCAAVLLSVLLSACSVFSPVPDNSNATYMVNTLPEVSMSLHRHATSLFVAVPQASPLFSTTDMVYSRYAYQIDRFAKNSWAETPVQMLQPLMVQTLQATHYFHAVSGTATVGQFNYMLTTQLLRFQQEFLAGHSQFHLTLRAQLIQSATNKIIASRQIDIIKPAPYASPYGGVIAANHATSTMLLELTQFCLRNQMSE